MVMIKYKDETQFSMDGYLYNNLQIVLNEAIPNNWDCFFIIFGREGTGKTTLDTQICYFLDNSFNELHIVWTPEQFDKAIDDAKEGDSIAWDEAITGAMSNQHAEEISRRIISKLTMIRKKKLKIGICFPYLYMLNKYFVSRCLFSIYVYAKGFGDRGYARFYDSRNTEKLYNLMKEKYRYDYAGAFSEAKHNFHFRFTSKFCADEKEYDRLKTIYSRLENDKTNNKYLIENYLALSYIRDNRMLGKYAKWRGYKSGNVYTNFLNKYSHITQTHKSNNKLNMLCDELEEDSKLNKTEELYDNHLDKINNKLEEDSKYL